MAEFAPSSTLEGGRWFAPGEKFLEKEDLQVGVVEAAQFIIACHLNPVCCAPQQRLQDEVVKVTGHALPAVPNTRSGDDDDYTVWLDPSRWLAVGPIASRWSRLRELQGAVNGASPEASASDTSDAMIILDISGTRAPALMAMACAIDIAPAVFAPPRTARSAFAGVGAILYRHRNGFRVHVDVALSAHVREWLELAERLLPPEGQVPWWASESGAATRFV